MHLGEEDSVLTNLIDNTSDVDPMTPSPVLQQLVACLENLLENNSSRTKPTLVLNGDILDLDFSGTGNALTTFQKFIELVMKKNSSLFSRIVYIPGNHDHHLWETARETQYVKLMENIPGDQRLFDPPHITNLFDDTIPSYTLNNLCQRLKNIDNVNIEIAYPNFAMCAANGKRSVVFSHGHYLEPIYRLMSTLHSEFFNDTVIATKVEDIESQNFAWVDFIWSTIGRSSTIGRDIEFIYEKMSEKESSKQILDKISNIFAKHFDIPVMKRIPWIGTNEHLESWVINKLLIDFFKDFTLEKRNTDSCESEKLAAGLETYLKDSLRQQFDAENRSEAAEDLTFVFGHTHKPYIACNEYIDFTKSVKIHNTGGWVVDTTETSEQHGASMTLMDSELNTVSLRLYKEGNYRISVEEPRRSVEPYSSLYHELSRHIDQKQAPWAEFSHLVSNAVKLRRKNLIQRVRAPMKTLAKQKIAETAAL